LTGNDTTVRSLDIGSVYTDVLYTALDGSTTALQVNDAFGIEEEAAVTSARIKLVHVAAKHGLVTVSSPTDDGFDEVEVGYLNVGIATWTPFPSLLCCCNRTPYGALTLLPAVRRPLPVQISDWGSGRIDSGKQQVVVRVNETVEILNSEFDFIDSGWYTVILTGEMGSCPNSDTCSCPPPPPPLSLF